MILDSKSPMQAPFLLVAGKKSLLSKIKRIEKYAKNSYSEILSYLTFLNFGVLKNIIFKLKNNIKTVRAGTK